MTRIRHTRRVLAPLMAVLGIGLVGCGTEDLVGPPPPPPPPAPPAAPTGVAASAVSDSEIEVSWNDVNGVIFEVHRCASAQPGAGCTDFTFRGELADASFTDSDLDPLSEYCYRIRGMVGSLQSDFSTAACGVTHQLPILFDSRWDADGDQEIWGIRADGSLNRQVSFNLFDDEEPAWSPDRSMVAFVSEQDGDDEIWVMNADGSNRTQLTFNTADDSRPQWSPDGTKIAFDSQRDGDNEIFVMDADGGNQTQLTFNTVDFDQGPTWTPDGMSIAFTTFRSGVTDEIWIMDADGGNQRILINTGSHDYQVDISPDGTKIVWTVLPVGGGDDEIFVGDFDGTTVTNMTQLTNNGSDDQEGTWSPDSQFIAFASERDGDRDIYTMTATGGSVTNLTNNNIRDSEPTWAH